MRYNYSDPKADGVRPYYAKRYNDIQKSIADELTTSDSTETKNSKIGLFRDELKLERNRIVEDLMTVIDDEFARFERDLRSDIAYKNTLTDWVSIGLTGTASLVHSHFTSKLLSGIDTGLKGANASIDVEVYKSYADTALMNQMETARNNIATEINKRKSEGDDTYPLENALHDLGRYFNAGTVTSALVELEKNSTKTLTESQQTLSAAKGELTLLSGPAPVTVDAGGHAGLSVAVGGAGPISYQWFRNGVPIVGATSSSIDIPDAQSKDWAGDYTVQIAKKGQVITTPAAKLIVTDVPPTLTADLDPQAKYAVNTALSVSFTGTEPFTVKWHRKTQTPASDQIVATETTKGQSSFTPNSAGEYYAVVSNSVKDVESKHATVEATQ